MRLVLTLLAALVLSVRPSAAQIVTGGAASGVFGQPSFTARELPFFTDVEPGGVVADARRGLLYVSDPARNRVLRYDTRTAPATHGPASGVLGQPGFASGTPATSRTGMNGPGALALDASGRLYVADGQNFRVLRFDRPYDAPNGAPADAVFGQATFEARVFGQGAGPVPFGGVSGLATSADDALFVVDASNQRVLRFRTPGALPSAAPPDLVLHEGDGPAHAAVDSSGTLYVSVGGLPGSILRFDDAVERTTGGAFDARFVLEDVAGLTTDAAGRLYATQAQFTRMRVLRFDAPRTEAPSSVPLVLSGTDDGGPQAFDRPGSLTIEGRRLWVTQVGAVLGLADADRSSGPVRADAWIGSGSPARPDRAWPAGVTVDRRSGKVFLADLMGNRVLRFASVEAFAAARPEGVLGQSTFEAAAARRSATGMNSPTALALDDTGRLYVTDYANNRVLRFDDAAAKPSGTSADGVLGQPTFEDFFIPTTFQSSAERFSYPGDLAAGADGTLFVADGASFRVLRFDDAATKPNGSPADGVLGQPDFTSATRRYPTDASVLTGPGNLALSRDGRLYVADGPSHRLLRYDDASNKPDGAPADGVLGQATFTATTSGTGPARLHSPGGIDIDDSALLYVADAWNVRVLGFETVDERGPLPNGASARFVLGQSDFTSREFGTTATRFSLPTNVAVTADARAVMVTDSENFRVLVFGDLSVDAERPVVPASRVQVSVRGPRVYVALPASEVVRVEVFDVLGRRVSLLHDGPADVLSLDLPTSLASGVYLVRARTNAAQATAPVVVR